MYEKKIAAICLLTAKPVWLRAAWRGGELFMSSAETFPVRRSESRPVIISKIEELESRGFEVLVAESTDFITSQAGIRVRLDDIGGDDIPVIVKALTIQRELSRQRAITYPDGAKGRYEMPETIVTTEHDKKGKATYDIDWAQLKGEQILTLLCCYATEFHNVSSASYLNAMFGEITEARPKGPLDPLVKIIQAQELEDLKNAPTSPLTGTKGYL